MDEIDLNYCAPQTGLEICEIFSRKHLALDAPTLIRLSMRPSPDRYKNPNISGRWATDRTIVIY
jgi:hypothetical protein